MRDPLFITAPLPCSRCGYELYTLAVDGACPECGTLVRRTLMLPMDRPGPDGLPRRSGFYLLADLAGCTIDAIHLVRDLVRRVAPDAGEHATAATLVTALRTRCREYFHDDAEAVELLAEWGIESGEALGRIVFSLADVGLIVLGPNDRVEDFDGVFELQSLFRV